MPVLRNAMLSLSALLLTASVPMLLAADAPQAVGKDAKVVKLEKHEDEQKVVVSIGGEEFAVYNYSKELPKPFFAPVRAAGGAVVTRTVEEGIKEHPWHKGIWVAVDEINEIKFWAEKGKILNFDVQLVEAEGNPARLQVINHWLSEDEKPMLEEKTLISIYPHRLMTYDIRFRPLDRTVVIGDTKEGLFGIRVAPTMNEKEGGQIETDSGVKGERDAWGKAFKWVDYSGPVDGKTYGAAIFDHPENFRPSRYHVRGYGLFTINPFGERAYTGGQNEAAPLELDVDEELRLRYGIYIHSGDAEEGKVGEVYRQYVSLE